MYANIIKTDKILKCDFSASSLLEDRIFNVYVLNRQSICLNLKKLT